MSARPHDVELRAIDELAANEKLNPTQRSIVLAVSIFAYDPGGGLGLGALARISGVSDATVRQHVRVLESDGWVRWHRKQRRAVTPGPRLQRQHEAVAR